MSFFRRALHYSSQFVMNISCEKGLTLWMCEHIVFQMTKAKLLLKFYFIFIFYWRQGTLRLVSGIVCLLWSAVCLLLPGSLHILVTWFWSTLVTNFASFMFMFFSQLSCAVLKFPSLRTNLTDEITIRNSLLLKILPQ